MKNLNLLLVFSIIILISTAFSSFKTIPDEKKSLSVEDAVRQNIITLSIKGLGGYSGECIEMTLENISEKDTMIIIESGRRLASADTNTQDILVVRKNEFLLAAGERKILKLFGFCCQASKNAPKEGEVFFVGKMANDKLVKLSNFLNKQNFSIDAQQKAVWVISDDKPVESIHDPDVMKVRLLHEFVSKLKDLKTKYPWYTMQYKSDTASLFSGVPTVLFANFEYDLWTSCKATLIMHDASGNVVKRFFEERAHSPNQYVYKFTLPVADMPRGTYYVRLFADGQMKYERSFTLK